MENNCTTLKIDTLDRIIRMLANAVSDDTTRISFQYVECKPLTENKVLLTATDGHILSQCEIEDEALFKAGLGYINREMLSFLKMVKKTNKYSIPVETDQNSLKIGGKQVFDQRKDFKFPNVNSIKPRWNGTFEVGLNPELLLALFESLKEDKRQKCAHLIFNSENDPIRVFIGESEGLLMPMRVSKRLKKLEDKK